MLSLRSAFVHCATMILVLLCRFSESEESLPGYILCQKLVQEGQQILVTSTAKNNELIEEKKAAAWMTENWAGSVQIVAPDYKEL